MAFWISISSIDILVGISPGAADGSLVLFSFRITKPQFLPGIFFGGFALEFAPVLGGEKIKKGHKRGAEALRGAREATGAAKASKKGVKRDTTAINKKKRDSQTNQI